jgi:hypothetical protein
MNTKKPNKTQYNVESENLYELQLPFKIGTQVFVDYYEKNKHLGLHNQLSLKHRPGMPSHKDGCGMAYCMETGLMAFSESEFTCYNDDLGDEIKNFLLQIEQIAFDYFAHQTGRIRIINLKFKTCLSLHQDYDQFRLHVPLITNPKSFFVLDDTIYRMPDEGALYYINTKVMHTAVNASFCYDRLHLVFGTYKN